MILPDMELEEQGLRRKCEDLRRTLAEKSKKLEQAQELYNKLKQKVLLSQPANAPVDVMSSRMGSEASRYGVQGQNPAGIGSRTNYFPDDSRSSRRHSGSDSVDNWNKPMDPQCESSLLLRYADVRLTSFQFLYLELQLATCRWLSLGLVSRPWETLSLTLCRQSLARVGIPSLAERTTMQPVATLGEHHQHHSLLQKETVGDMMISLFPGQLRYEE